MSPIAWILRRREFPRFTRSADPFPGESRGPGTIIAHRRRGVLILLAALLWGPALYARVWPADKAIVFAWDGTVPAFAEELLKAGKLPHLARLISEGAYAGDVIPGFPSKTAPGFASLITGAPPRVTGISGNRVPRAPREKHTILESLAGFAEAPLRAEPLWAAAHRGGKRVVISHIPIFGGEQSEQAVRFAGYNMIAGRDGIVTGRALTSENAIAWTDPPPSEAPPVPFAFAAGGARFFGLLIDDPDDRVDGYDTMILASGPNGRSILARLKPGPAGKDNRNLWSEPIAVKSAGGEPARAYFRLFDLKTDGGDFFLYHSRPMRELRLPHADSGAGAVVRTFVGNGASFLYQQGAFGRTLANGGDGRAEARYLDTIYFAQHQLMETNRWAMENLPWDLYFAYTPFPDEAEHAWRGHLDPTLSSYRADLAERLRPFLERVYISSDEHLGVFLGQRPEKTIIALISDHGLQGVNRRVALNDALRRAGLLALDRQGRVDLSKSSILYPAVNNGYLLINSTDRKEGIVAPEERSDVVRRTRELLLSLRDGERPVVAAIFDAEVDGEAKGIGGETGGDLYLELAPGYDFDSRLTSAGSPIIETQPYGVHGGNPEQPSMRTLMVLHGPGIGAGRKIAGARIIDFAPTLARLLNLPDLKDATGRLLHEALVQPQ